MTMKGFVTGGKQILQSLIQIILVGAFPVLQYIVQGQEQTIVGKCRVWSVQWVDETFAAQLEQLLADDVYNVGFGIVVEEAYEFVAMPPALHLTRQAIL